MGPPGPDSRVIRLVLQICGQIVRGVERQIITGLRTSESELCPGFDPSSASPILGHGKYPHVHTEFRIPAIRFATGPYTSRSRPG
jgi:hypothetical protein